MLTQERLKEVLDYNSGTGIFTWLVTSSSKAIIGDIAGGFKDGYIIIGIDNIVYRAHRLAWFYYYGVWPEYDLDHEDRIRHHNWISNLRESSYQCNNRNRGINSNNTSGVIGVSPVKDRGNWLAGITVNKKGINLGYHKEFEDAVKARWKAEVKYKFPLCCTTSTAYLYLKNNNLLKGEKNGQQSVK